MSVSIPKLGDALVYNYHYDQLNRLVNMEAYSGLTNTGFQPVVLNDYKEQMAYDPNGNILYYNRKGAPAAGKPLEMDNLSYHYNANTNQLNHVEDGVPAVNYAEDIDGQNSDYYQYDAIGNLISEGSSSISWNVYGKIAGITKSGGPTIAYSYDAAGNRISKTVGDQLTVYVRDGSGNVMSVYEKSTATALRQTEVHLYGSSRLGLVRELTQAPQRINLAAGYAAAGLYTFTRGEKVFELSNHLGNVLVTVSDKKLQHDAGGGVLDYYLADVVSAQDYAPFGMQLVGRKWNSSTYRFGFNGKENDGEVKGERISR
jgi:YD repeat-containing protein